MKFTASVKQHLLFLGLLFFLALIIPAIIGLSYYNSMMTKEIELLKDKQYQKLSLANQMLSNQLGHVEHSARLLRLESSLTSALKEVPLNQDAIEQVFLSFSGAIEQLLQLRWIDKFGRERVKIDLSSNTIDIIRDHRLQVKSHRYYFTESMNMDHEDVYISPLDLNVEHGQVVQPFQPTFRVAIQSGDPKNPSGIIVLNYNLSVLLDEIKGLSDDVNDLRFILPSGYWAAHPDRNWEWGQYTGNEDLSFGKTYPEEWAYIQDRTVTHIEQNNKLFTIIPIRFSSGHLDSNHGFLKSRVQDAYFTGLKRHVLAKTLIVSSLFLLSGAFITWLLWRNSVSSLMLRNQLLQEKDRLITAMEEQKDLLEQQQNLQNDLLEAGKLSALGMTVAGVAHELNTPIGGALLTNQTLKKDIEILKNSVEEGLTKQALETYIEQASQGISLMGQNLHSASELVRSFKRLAIDRASTSIEHFTPASVIQDLSYAMLPRLRKERVKFSFNVDESAIAEGYPGVFSQIIQNFIMNAINHAFEGKSDRQINLNVSFDKSNMWVEFSDNGVGIDQAMRAGIFEPFKTSARARGNTGLGLHFVHQWVTQVMKGRITVESEKGQGTTFKLLIPRVLKVKD